MCIQYKDSLCYDSLTVMAPICMAKKPARKRVVNFMAN